MLFFSSAFAGNAYFEHAPLGWHWNNIPKKQKIIKKQPVKRQASLSQMSAPEQIKTIHNAMIMAKDMAIMNPTPQNIASFLGMQQWMYQQSSRFANNWARTLLIYPEYNYRITHPTSNYILQYKHIEHHKQEKAMARKLAREYTLFYFYRGQNPLDQAFAKSVKSFASEYFFRLIGASMDKHALPNIKININGSDEYRAFHLKALPALVLVNPASGQSKVLHYGYTSINGLLDAIYNLVTQFGEKKS